ASQTLERDDVPAAWRAGGLLRRRAGIHRSRHRPGRAADVVREPGGDLQRPGAARIEQDHGGGELRRDAYAVPADREARGAAQAARGAAAWAAGVARAVAHAGAV